MSLNAIPSVCANHCSHTTRGVDWPEKRLKHERSPMKKLIVATCLAAVAGWAYALPGTITVGGHTLNAEWSKYTPEGKPLEGYRSTGVWIDRDREWTCINCVDFTKLYPFDQVESGKATGTNQDTYYFVQLDKHDPSIIWVYSIAKKGKWLVELPEKNDSAASCIDAIEVDCTKRRIRTVSSTFYNDYLDRGKVVRTFNDEGKWQRVVPRSFGDNFAEIRCYKPE